MAKVFDKHIRISSKRHRLHGHLSSIPAEAVRDEMLTLMEIGLAMLNNSVRNHIHVEPTSLTPLTPEAVIEPGQVISDGHEQTIDEFDISDAMFTVYE